MFPQTNPSPALIFFFALICATTLPLLQAATKSPDQVIELFRHGARTPLFDYELPSWVNFKRGQLTTAGMLQHYNLGKAIAAKYPHLVEPGYNPDEILMLANTAQRTIDSAMSQLSGMFRGKTSTLQEFPQKDLQDKIVKKIAPLLPPEEANRGEFVPVKVDIVSGLDQELIFNGRNHKWCPRISDLHSENALSAAIQNGWNAFQESVKQANTHLTTTPKITSMHVLNCAYDVFIASVFDNKTLPDGINDPKLLEGLNYAQAYYQYVLEQNQIIQKGLTSFPTLRAIAEQMTNFREGKTPKKLALLSGHDMNIYAVLSSFGIISTDCFLANYNDHMQDKNLSFPNCQFPKFAANLIFELYNDTANPYVKFYYNDILIPLCGGQETCPYQEFVAFLHNAGGNHTLESWNIGCKSKLFFVFNYLLLIEIESSQYLQWLIFGSIILIVTIGFTFLFKSLKKNKWNLFKVFQKDEYLLQNDDHLEVNISMTKKTW